MAMQIQLRRDTAANWTSVNPVLAQGELGFETDTLRFKLGTGSLAWASLAYTLNTVLYGSTAPLNSLGVNGDFYFNTALFAIYGPKTSGSWPTGVAVTTAGPVGATFAVVGSVLNITT